MWVGVGLVEVVGDVVFGGLYGGGGEDVCGVVVFDEFVGFVGVGDVEECCFVGDLGCLLYVVCYDYDGEFVFEFVD